VSHLSKAEAAEPKNADDTSGPATELASTVITRGVTSEFN